MVSRNASCPCGWILVQRIVCVFCVRHTKALYFDSWLAQDSVGAENQSAVLDWHKHQARLYCTKNYQLPKPGAIDIAV